METELIAEVVAQFLDEGSCDSTEFDLDARSGIEKHLISKFNSENYFSINESGELAADIPTEELLIAFREIRGGD